MDFAVSRLALSFTRGPTVCLKGAMCAGVCQNREPENTMGIEGILFGMVSTQRRLPDGAPCYLGGGHPLL